MSSRTPNQEKALRWFVETNDLVPQLSTHPVDYFKDREGNERKEYISHIVMNWETERKAKKSKV